MHNCLFVAVGVDSWQLVKWDIECSCWDLFDALEDDAAPRQVEQVGEYISGEIPYHTIPSCYHQIPLTSLHPPQWLVVMRPDVIWGEVLHGEEPGGAPDAEPPPDGVPAPSAAQPSHLRPVRDYNEPLLGIICPEGSLTLFGIWTWMSL